MDNTNNSLPISVLNGHDYDYWSIKMRTILIGKSLSNIVEAGYEEPADWSTLQATASQAKKETKKKNSLTLYRIQFSLNKSLFPGIVDAISAKEAWKSLQEAHQGSDQVTMVKLQTLKREFKNLKMQEVESVSKYCARVKDVVNKMATLFERLNKEIVVKKVLRILTPRWNHVALIIKEIKYLTT